MVCPLKQSYYWNGCRRLARIWQEIGDGERRISPSCSESTGTALRENVFDATKVQHLVHIEEEGLCLSDISAEAEGVYI